MPGWALGSRDLGGPGEETQAHSSFLSGIPGAVWELGRVGWGKGQGVWGSEGSQMWSCCALTALVMLYICHS